MNFIIRNLLLFTVLLCTVACSLDENFDQSSLENIDFRVSVAGQSRVAMQKNGSGDFQAGDEVALRVYEFQPDKLQDNKLLYCEGNRWTSSLYWKDWKGTPHFYAVWPSVTQIELWEGTCWYVHRVSQNQSAEKDFLSSDLLVADAEGQRYSPVNLDFRHAMSRVTVNVRNMEETCRTRNDSRCKCMFMDIYRVDLLWQEMRCRLRTRRAGYKRFQWKKKVVLPLWLFQESWDVFGQRAG